MLGIIAGSAAAEAFLLDPANYIGWTVFNCDVSGLGRAQKDHRLAVYKSHIRKVKGDRFGFAAFAGERALHLRQILFSELAAEPHPAFFVFSTWSNL